MVAIGTSIGFGVAPTARKRGPWSPLSLGGKLRYWLDAEAGNTLTTSGGLVSAWADRKGGTVAAVQGTSGFRPTYSATGLNGRPAVVFDGTDDYLQSAAIAAIPSGTDTVEAWLLASDTALAVNTLKKAFALSSATATRRSIARRNTAPHYVGMQIGTGAGVDLTYSTTAVSDGVHLYRAVFENNNQRLYQDNMVTPVVSRAITMSVSSNRLVVGSESGTTGFWQGPINTLLFTTPLTNDEVTEMANYLKARGGIV